MGEIQNRIMFRFAGWFPYFSGFSVFVFCCCSRPVSIIWSRCTPSQSQRHRRGIVVAPHPHLNMVFSSVRSGIVTPPRAIQPMPPLTGLLKLGTTLLSMYQKVHGPCGVKKGTGGYKYTSPTGLRGALRPLPSPALSARHVCSPPPPGHFAFSTTSTSRGSRLGTSSMPS